MAVLRDYPYTNHCFDVDIGGGDSLRGVIEVQLPDLCLALNSARSGADSMLAVPQNVAKPYFTTCTIRRAYQGDLTLYQWWQQASVGTDRRQMHRNVTIRLHSEDHQQIVTSWKLLQAVPARYSFSPLASRDGSVLVETLELAFESLEME